MITSDDIIKAARSLVGTPFHHHGRLPGVGVDCVGLLWCTAQAVGIQCPNDTSYDRIPNAKALLTYIGHCGLPRLTLPVKGSFGAFWLYKPDNVVHAAVITGDTIIHTNESVGKVVEHHFSDRWRRHLVQAFGLPTVVYEE